MAVITFTRPVKKPDPPQLAKLVSRFDYATIDGAHVWCLGDGRYQMILEPVNGKDVVPEWVGDHVVLDEKDEASVAKLEVVITGMDPRQVVKSAVTLAAEASAVEEKPIEEKPVEDLGDGEMKVP